MIFWEVPCQNIAHNRFILFETKNSNNRPQQFSMMRFVHFANKLNNFDLSCFTPPFRTKWSTNGSDYQATRQTSNRSYLKTHQVTLSHHLVRLREFGKEDNKKEGRRSQTILAGDRQEQNHEWLYFISSIRSCAFLAA